MKVAILLNKDHPYLRTFGKRALSFAYQLAHGDYEALGGTILPEYDSFAKVLDPSPVLLGTEGTMDWKALKDCDLLIWEWGWTDAPAKAVLEIRRRAGTPLLMFPGPLDRFWREMEFKDFGCQLEAAHASRAIGVMLKDTIPFYQALVPSARVFHMPVPVDAEYFRKFALPKEQRDKRKALLTAPTRFAGPASQLPIGTYLAFKSLLKERPQMEGLCYVYSDEEQAQAQEAFRRLGLSSKIEIRTYLRPIFRYFENISACCIGLNLPHGLIQGRTALAAACLGIPMVLSDEIETHRFLYPRTIARWYDVETASRLCLRLLEDDSFHESVQEEAWSRVDYYSVELCRKRMLEGVDFALEKKPVV